MALIGDIVAQPLVRTGCTLGEGPLWSPKDATLWFVDIKAPRLYRYTPETGALDTWPAPAQIGWVLPTDADDWIAGLASGLHRFDPADGTFTWMAAVEPDLPGNRLNDAATDPQGRIWFGSMDNAEADRTGHLYRFQRGELLRTDVQPVEITNGPAVSPDGSTLYLVDTLAGAIDACEIAADGTLGPLRRFVTIDPADGHPDGAICDAEGGVWLGLYGGWAARRYAPDGVLTDTVQFPVANITKIALGGPDLCTAYATTAQQGMTADQLSEQPHAGDIFTFRVSVPGMPVTPVGIAQ